MFVALGFFVSFISLPRPDSALLRSSMQQSSGGETLNYLRFSLVVVKVAARALGAAFEKRVLHKAGKPPGAAWTPEVGRELVTGLVPATHLPHAQLLLPAEVKNKLI